MPAREADDADAAGQNDTGDGEYTISGIEAPTFAAPLASPGDAEAEARKEAGVGIGLADDLCGPSARPSSRASSPATSRRPSICCCSSSPAACSPPATMTTCSTSGRPRHRTVRPCGSTTMLSAPSMLVRSTSRSTGPRKSSTGPACPMPRAFAELRALPERDKQILFASCVARTLKGPAGVRTQSPARGRSDRRPARHRLRRRCPRQPRSALDRRSAVVAAAQGPHPRHRPRNAGRDLGASGGQAEEGGDRQGDAGRLRPRRRRARRGHGRGPRRGHRLDTARLPRLRYGHRRRQRCGR